MGEDWQTPRPCSILIVSFYLKSMKYQVLIRLAQVAGKWLIVSDFPSLPAVVAGVWTQVDPGGARWSQVADQTKPNNIKVKPSLFHLAQGQGVGGGCHWRVFLLLSLNIVKNPLKSSASQNCNMCIKITIGFTGPRVPCWIMVVIWIPSLSSS